MVSKFFYSDFFSLGRGVAIDKIRRNSYTSLSHRVIDKDSDGGAKRFLKKGTIYYVQGVPKSTINNNNNNNNNNNDNNDYEN